MGKIDEFFKFEVDNELFGILDKDGHRPWESIRFYVCCNVVNSFAPPHKLSREKKSLFTRICQHVYLSLYSIVYILRNRRRPYMFMLSSRDKKEGEYYDKISEGVYGMVDKSKTFSIDTIWHSDNYRYKGYTCPNEIVPLLKLFVRKNRDFSFEGILALLKAKYPDLCMSIDELNLYYNEFKIQYAFYKFLFKFCGTQKIFMVQNGLQKGLMAAANEAGIEVWEFQHGQINHNHPGYSYPDNTITEGMIYHPSKLLTFGPFWHKDRCYPGVENIVIGNDSYAEIIEPCNSALKNHILVISNMDDGKFLFSFVKEVLSIDNNFYFYFKLHPNQYEEKTYFDELTRDDSNIEVITSDYSINQLLAKTDGVLLVQSTVELEALKMGRRVFVIKYGSYENMSFVFDENGVLLINSAKEFIDNYESHLGEILPKRDDIFEPFNTMVLNKLQLF